MAKITKFGRDAGFFYDRAIQKADLNDDIACLDYLHSAQKFVEPFSENDIALRLEKAEAYAKLGLFGESNKEFFKLFSFAGDYLDEVFYGLVRNFFISGNSEAAAYYLSLGVDCGAIDPGEFEFDGDFPQEPEQPKLRLVKPHSSEYTLSVARQLMAGNDPGYAKQMLRSITPESESYIEAANCAALIELSENNVEAGLKIADEALERDPENINSLITKMLAHNLARQNDEIRAVLERIHEMNLTEWHDFVKLALCCAETGDSENVYYFSRKALNFTPYEREMLLYNAIAAFNLGHRREAKEAVCRLCVLYPDDYALKYYARKIDSGTGETPLDFSSGIDSAARDELTGYLENQLARAKNPAGFADRFKDDERFKDSVIWALQNGNESLINYISSVLSLSKGGTQIALDVLVDPDYRITVKKSLLNNILRNTRLKKILVVINNQIQWLTPQMPAVTRNRDFINAYCQVYSSLAFIENSFNRKLNMWYKKTVEALGAKKGVKYKANAVAALIAFKSRASKIFELSSYCCEVFDCEMQEFMLYFDIVDNYKDPQRDKKRGVSGNND